MRGTNESTTDRYSHVHAAYTSQYCPSPLKLVPILRGATLIQPHASYYLIYGLPHSNNDTDFRAYPDHTTLNGQCRCSQRLLQTHGQNELQPNQRQTRTMQNQIRRCFFTLDIRYFESKKIDQPGFCVLHGLEMHIYEICNTYRIPSGYRVNELPCCRPSRRALQELLLLDKPSSVEWFTGRRGVRLHSPYHHRHLL